MKGASLSVILDAFQDKLTLMLISFGRSFQYLYPDGEICAGSFFDHVYGVWVVGEVFLCVYARSEFFGVNYGDLRKQNGFDLFKA